MMLLVVVVLTRKIAGSSVYDMCVVSIDSNVDCCDDNGTKE